MGTLIVCLMLAQTTPAPEVEVEVEVPAAKTTTGLQEELDALKKSSAEQLKAANAKTKAANAKTEAYKKELATRPALSPWKVLRIYEHVEVKIPGCPTCTQYRVTAVMRHNRKGEKKFGTQVTVSCTYRKHSPEGDCTLPEMGGTFHLDGINAVPFDKTPSNVKYYRFHMNQWLSILRVTPMKGRK